MKACSNLDIQQVFTSYNNSKGNADTERMIRTMKEELFWLREWEGERELGKKLNKFGLNTTTGIICILLLDTERQFKQRRGTIGKIFYKNMLLE